MRQRIGKSTGVRKLAGDGWFFDTPITMGSLDGYQAMRGKWIGELVSPGRAVVGGVASASPDMGREP